MPFHLSVNIDSESSNWLVPQADINKAKQVALKMGEFYVGVRLY